MLNSTHFNVLSRRSSSMSSECIQHKKVPVDCVTGVLSAGEQGMQWSKKGRKGPFWSRQESSLLFISHHDILARRLLHLQD